MWNTLDMSVHLPEKIQYPSRIEEVNEENKIQKMYSSQSISQTDRETISYSNPIYTSLTIPQTTIGLSEYQSQQGGLRHICLTDWRNQMVDKNYKNQQTSSYFDQSDFPSSNNNRCFSNSMGSNFSGSKSKCKNKSKKRKGEINPRGKESCNSVRNFRIAQKKWSNYMKKQTLNLKEITAIYLALHHFLPLIKKSRTDNTAAMYNIKKSGTNLYHTARKIWKKLLDIKSSTYPRKDKYSNRQTNSIGDERRLSTKRE
jgi:hypothetical protein